MKGRLHDLFIKYQAQFSGRGSWDVKLTFSETQAACLQRSVSCCSVLGTYQEVFLYLGPTVPSTDSHPRYASWALTFKNRHFSTPTLAAPTACISGIQIQRCILSVQNSSDLLGPSVYILECPSSCLPAYPVLYSLRPQLTSSLRDSGLPQSQGEVLMSPPLYPKATHSCLYYRTPATMFWIVIWILSWPHGQWFITSLDYQLLTEFDENYEVSP